MRRLMLFSFRLDSFYDSWSTWVNIEDLGALDSRMVREIKRASSGS